MNIDTYTIMCGVSVHVIAEAKRPTTVLEKANTFLGKLPQRECDIVSVNAVQERCRPIGRIIQKQLFVPVICSTVFILSSRANRSEISDATECCV